MTDIKLLKIEQVMAKTGLARSTINAMVKDGKLPRPVHLEGSRSVRWVESELDDWINDRIAERDAQEAQ